MRICKNYLNNLVYILLLFLLISCEEPKEKDINLFFDMPRQYRHERFKSEEECRQINASLSVLCNEVIWFYTDGKASVLLEGSDLILPGTYKRTDNKIEAVFQNGPTLTLNVTFNVISDIELLRVNNNTIWKKY